MPAPLQGGGVERRGRCRTDSRPARYWRGLHNGPGPVGSVLRAEQAGGLVRSISN